MFILNGRPNLRQQSLEQIADHWIFRDELTVVNGMISKGHEVIIPNAPRPTILEILNRGHFRCEKTLTRARDVMFWPKISVEIIEMMLNCPVTLERGKSNAKEPLKPHDIPDYPWQTVTNDLILWECFPHYCRLLQQIF